MINSSTNSSANSAVIVSYARTPIGKAYRGAFNNTTFPRLSSLAMKEVVKRAEVEAKDIDDVTWGSALTQASAAVNSARHAVLCAGFPDTIPAQTIDRQCASGLSALAIAVQQINNGDASIALAGGAESISLCQNEHWNDYLYQDKNINQGYYFNMIKTAEVVAKKWGISRQEMDEYALISQERTENAQKNNVFSDEIFAVQSVKSLTQKDTKEVTNESVKLEQDECSRAGSKLDKLLSLPPIFDNGKVSAGNASQLSDGAAALLVMNAKEAEERNLKPLGVLLGVAVAGCAPEEMGIGPIFAIPKLLKRFNLEVSDIDLWEINEAFAAQVLACSNFLSIPLDKLNVNGGAISIGHPYGMSGARMSGHLLLEGQRRKLKYGVVSMCIGGGQGAAALFKFC